MDDEAVIVLGLHTGHDGSAAIVKDGKLVASLSRERLTRARKTHGIDSNLIHTVLETAGVNLSEVDAVALSDYDLGYCHDAIAVTSPETGELVENTWNRIWGNDVLEFDCEIENLTFRVFNVGHHTAHCAAAFYTSPFHEAWCVSMDSSGGEFESNFLMAHGKGNRLRAVDAPYCHVGVAYGQFCENLGVGPQMFKCGSLMALAGYGTVSDRMRQRIDQYVKEAFFVRGQEHYRTWIERLWEDMAGRHGFDGIPDGEKARNVAADIQFLFEQVILECLRRIETKCLNLCLGGGSFLNCSANTQAARHSNFSFVHHFPACTDDGLAAGAALYVTHHMFNLPRAKYQPQELAYLGPHRNLKKKPPIKKIARDIANGKVIAWSMGRSEGGPRALGHRSLLADARDYQNRERINNQIKQREWYRPLAPSVAAEESVNWFNPPYASPYMLYTTTSQKPAEIPAAMHIDGTARHQSVRKQDNPEFWELLQALPIPVVLNTSLNGAGEPICETDADAMRFFETHDVDALMLNGEYLEKS